MTLDLKAIRERAEAASPRPWRAMREGNQYVGTELVGASRVEGLVRPWNPHASISQGVTASAKQHETTRLLDEDADFVAHAREDIPALLELVDTMAGALLEVEIVGHLAGHPVDAALTLAGFPDQASRDAERKRRAAR